MLWTLLEQSLLKSFLRVEDSLSLGGLFPCFWLALPSYIQVVEEYVIVGGAVDFHFFALLLPGDDDVAGIPASIDDGAEVSRGTIIEVALPSLVLLDHAVPTFSALCVPELAAFFLDVVFIFYLDGVCNIETHHHVPRFGRANHSHRCNRLAGHPGLHCLFRRES
jgi:hypothetical protein